VTCLCYLALLVCAASDLSFEQRLGDAVCRLELDARAVALSGELKLTLSIEGPSPVEAEPPRPLTRSPDWRVRANAPTSTSLPNGRVRWQQSFYLEPFQAGSHVPLPLEPIRYRTGNELRDWTVVWETQMIRVTTTVPDADLAYAKTVTDIEEVPPDPSPQFKLWIGALLLTVALGAGLGLVLLLRRRRVVGSRPAPLALALAELNLLEANGIAPEDLPKVADIARVCLEAQFHLRATRQTSAEFLASLRQHSGLLKDQLTAIDQLLTRCDLVKFAADRPKPEECQLLVESARHVLTAAAEAAQSTENELTLSDK